MARCGFPLYKSASPFAPFVTFCSNPFSACFCIFVLLPERILFFCEEVFSPIRPYAGTPIQWSNLVVAPLRYVLRDLFVQSPPLWPWCEILVALLKHPLVVPKPVNRPLHGLANTQLGSPAGLSHLGCIQKDERIITNPAPFSTGEFQSGIHFKSLTDPRD